jgi:uncharacterized tellurite resistance protein B-like protein
MFERIIARLRAPAADFTAMPEADARHALGALLVRVAKADGAYLFQEIEEIDHLLADLYGLNAVEAAIMRAECEKLEAAMPDTNELAHILTCDVTSGECNKLISALWKVADADGQRHDTEEQVVAIATQTFGMAPEAAAALRG